VAIAPVSPQVFHRKIEFSTDIARFSTGCWENFVEKLGKRSEVEGA
jgi:hypothetical protein